MNPADKNFSIFKTDDDKRLVFGWASVAITVNGEQLEDRQQDIIDPEDLEEAAYEYVLNFRDTGEEHNPTMRKKGKLVESCVLTAEKQKAMGIPEGSVPVGWWIGFKIEDDTAWERVKSGQYRMFSIEGKANREPVEKSDGPTGCGVLVVRDGKVLTGTRVERASRGQICGPGGHIEAGETPEDAAVREAYEEFGIICRDLKPIGTIPDGTSAIFMCSDFSGTPRTDEKEMTNVQWKSPEEIEETGTFPPFWQSLKLLSVEKSRSSYGEYPSYSMWLEENLDATIEQQKAAKAYYETNKEEAKRNWKWNPDPVAKTFDEVLKFNPYHDSHGRFASVNSYTSFSANQNTTAGRMAIERHSRNSNNSRITNINPAANKQRVIDQWKETQDFQDYQAKLQTDVQHCYRINSSIAQKIVNTQHADITSTDLDALTPHFKDGPMKLPNGDNNTSGYFQSKNSMRINQKIRENVKDGKSWDDGFDLDDQKTIAAMEKGMKPLSKGLQLRRNVNDSCMEGCGISAKDIQDAISDPSNIKNISNKLLGEWGVCANYQSTGYDFGDTSSFSNRSVSLVINAPKGTKAFVSPTMMESEVVLARNTKIRYTGNVSVETRMDGTKYLAVEAVVDKDFN